jgi:predicted TPR repeat methyltransferase
VCSTACVLLAACLQLVVPGSDLWKRAADMAATATALSAAASAFGATAAATASGAGGSTSLIRSLGHTQFLAMSVSMAVPWLPAEYIRLCTGLR